MKIPMQVRYNYWRRVDLAAVVQRFLVGIAVLSMVGLATWGGYEHGRRESSAPRQELAESLKRLLETERNLLDSEKADLATQIDPLALQLGKLQARLMRLEAMGEKLVELGGLDREEFDFSQEPAQGGPSDEGAVSADIVELFSELGSLSDRISDRAFKLELLEDLLLRQQVRGNMLPNGRPVESGWISSHYGWRKDPFTGKKNVHHGLDYVGKSGTEILAVANGVVTFSGWRSGFGRLVEIRHGDGYITRYGHNKSLLVKEGELVRQGQVIATMGSSGRSTGTHLHFEVVRDGKTINPLKFVKKAEAEQSEG